MRKTSVNENLNEVSVVRKENIIYPRNPPFNPPEIYPEYPFSSSLTDDQNKVYALIRESLIQLGLDKENMGTKSWNPFKNIIKPGNTVLIKPNFVKEKNEKGFGIFSLVTHGSVLRAIIDYVYVALKGKGQIIIGDTPLESTDFDKVCKLNGIKDTVDFLKNNYDVPIELIDLRKSRTFFYGERIIKKELKGDPKGYTLVDLKDESLLSDLDNEKVNYHTLGDHTISQYNPYEVKKGLPNNRHSLGKHQYGVGNTVLTADAVISVAKLKTHKKTGITLNLKNMIGIINGKEFIPHHRPGPYPVGDSFLQYPPKHFIIRRNIIKNTIRFISKYPFLYNSLKFTTRDLFKLDFNLKPRIEWGDWYGNNTLWRTILDINKILLYSDKNGEIQEEKQRNYFCFVDGVVGMDGEGPVSGRPYKAGVIIAGHNQVSVDVIGAEIMGFDSGKIRLLLKAGHLGENRLDKIKVIGELPRFKFKPSMGWIGKIERKNELIQTV